MVTENRRRRCNTASIHWMSCRDEEGFGFKGSLESTVAHCTRLGDSIVVWEHCDTNVAILWHECGTNVTLL